MENAVALAKAKIKQQKRSQIEKAVDDRILSEICGPQASTRVIVRGLALLISAVLVTDYLLLDFAFDGSLSIISCDCPRSSNIWSRQLVTALPGSCLDGFHILPILSRMKQVQPPSESRKHSGSSFSCIVWRTE